MTNDTDARAPRTTGATAKQIEDAAHRKLVYPVTWPEETKQAYIRQEIEEVSHEASYLVPPEFAIVPRAMLERIVDANDRAQEYGGVMLVLLGHWQDITGWAEEALNG